jgi:hypothetical protein
LEMWERIARGTRPTGGSDGTIRASPAERTHRPAADSRAGRTASAGWYLTPAPRHVAPEVTAA